MSGCTSLCNQGRDCTCIQSTCQTFTAPPKSTRPAWMNGAAKVAPMRLRTCDELGVYQSRDDCDCAHPTASDVDGGNVNFDNDEMMVLSPREWLFVTLAMLLALTTFLIGIPLLIRANWDRLSAIVSALPG